MTAYEYLLTIDDSMSGIAYIGIRNTETDYEMITTKGDANAMMSVAPGGL